MSSNNYNSIQFESDDKSNSKLYPAQTGYHQQYSYPMSEFYQYQYAGYTSYQGAQTAYNQYAEPLNMNISPSAPMPYLFSHLEPEPASTDLAKAPEPHRTASTSSSSSSINQHNPDNLDLADASESQASSVTGAKPPVIYAWMKKVHVNSSKPQTGIGLKI